MRPLVTILLLACAAAAQETDIRKVRPEDFRATDVRPLLAKAHEAYGEKRYEEAARRYLEVLQTEPANTNALYNLACCYGLLGIEEQALGFLKASWNAGFRDLEHIKGDPDFEKVRGSEAYRELLAKLEADAERRNREAGRTLEIDAAALADVRVVEPTGEWNRNDRRPLVIGLHGLGDSGASFAALFLRREIEQPFLFCVPQAPYAFEMGNKLGWSWTSREGGPPRYMRSERLAEKYVLKVLEAVKREYRVDESKVFLLGFSQGAGMAAYIGMRNPELFRSVFPIGGWLERGAYTVEELERAAKYGRFTIFHSPEDRVVPFEFSKNGADFLAQQGIKARLVRYEGGHKLPKQLMEQIAVLVASPAKEPAETK